jgi:hypothetical protein
MENQQLKIEQERRAEQKALPFVSGVSFTDCLRVNGIATELLVDGNLVLAHRISGAWPRFLRAEGEVTGEQVTTTTKKGKQSQKPVVKEPMDLSEAESLAKRMFTWMTTSYSETYQAIATDEERQWLTTVIRFVVMQRIMEKKYHQSIPEGSGFIDEAVVRKVAEIYRLVEETSHVLKCPSVRLVM